MWPTLTGAKMNQTTLVVNKTVYSFGYTGIINGTINNVQEHQIRKDAKRLLSLPYAKNDMFDFSEINDASLCVVILKIIRIKVRLYVLLI